MAGLFMSPQDAQMMERQAGGADPYGAATGALFNLGGSVGNAGQRYLGGDTSTELQRRAAQVQAIAKTVDWKSQESIMNGMNAFNQGGFQEEAFALQKLLTTPGKPVDQYSQSEPYDQVIQNKTVRGFDRWNAKDDKYEFVKIGEATPDTEDAGTPTEPNRNVYDKIRLEKEESDTLFAKLGAQPAYRSVRGNASKEALEALPGRVKSTSEQMKIEGLRLADSWRNGAQPTTAQELKDVFGDNLTPDQLMEEYKAFVAAPDRSMNRIFGGLSDGRWIQRGYDRYVTGGGLNRDTNEELIGPGKVDIQPNEQTDYSPVLKENAQFEADKESAMDSIGLDGSGQIKGFVSSDQEGKFVLKRYQPSDLGKMFRDMPESNEEMYQRIKDNFGVDMTPSMFESHAASWDYMREGEGPEYVEQYIRAANTPGSNELSRLKANTILRYTKGQNAAALAHIIRINAYLDRIGEFKQPAGYKGGRYSGVNPRTSIPYE